MLFSVCIDLALPSALFAGAAEALHPPSEQDYTKRRRKSGGKGIFSELEVFRHNLDMFLGPSLHIGNGSYFDELQNEISRTTVNFKPGSATVNKMFITGTLGIQYRNMIKPDGDGIIGLISLAGGLAFQQRGYEYKYEISYKKQSDTLSDFFNFSENCRANYLSVPLSVRIGRRAFIDAGLNLDFLISGNSEVDLERSAGYTGDVSKNPGYQSFFGGYKGEFNIQNVLPVVTLGYSVFGGINFNENFGMRMGVNMNNSFFKENSNPANSNFSSMIFTIQLIGSINTNRF